MSSDTPTVAQSIIEKQEREIQYLERQLSALRAERDEARESAHDLNADLTAAEQRCATLTEELQDARAKLALAAESEAGDGEQIRTLTEERDGQLTEIRRLADFVRQVLGEAFSREELRNEARLILNNLSSGGPSK